MTNFAPALTRGIFVAPHEPTVTDGLLPGAHQRVHSRLLRHEMEQLEFPLTAYRCKLDVQPRQVGGTLELTFLAPLPARAFPFCCRTN